MYARLSLERLIPAEVKSGALQDFDRRFTELISEKGRPAACLWFWRQIILMFPSIIVLRIKWSFIMFSNYLKVAFRNIQRHKGYTLINILGLTLATAACIFIILYLHFELSYDRHFENFSNIYRLTNDIHIGDTKRHYATIPGPPGPTFTEEIPEVLGYTRLRRLNPRGAKLGIIKDGEMFEETGIFLADSTFSQIFDYGFLNGDPNTALDEPDCVVLTETFAAKLFGDENPIGKILRINSYRIGDVRVTGVIEDPPPNTHFKFKMLVSHLSIDEERRKRMMFHDWGYFPFFTYLRIDRKADLTEVKKKFAEIYEKYSGERHRALGGYWYYHIQKITDIHLNSHLEGEMEPNNSIEYIYLQFIIAGLIIVIACANFINLFIARSSDRSKEVGIRKVFGAVKMNIIGQIFSESLIMIILSVLLGIISVILLLPVFNSLTGLKITATYLFQKQILLLIFGLIAVTSLAAGIYPSIFSARFRPIKTMSSNLKNSKRRKYFRQSLVMVQFVISISLIFSTIIVLNQLNFMRTKNPGFDKEQVVVIRMRSGSLRNQGRMFKEQLKDNPKIFKASFSTSIPGKNTATTAFQPEGYSDDSSLIIESIRVDFDYLDTYKLDTVYGRDFSSDISADSTNSYMLNEQAAKLIGWTGEEALNKSLSNLTTGEPEKTIIGIIKDYHHRSMKEDIAPIIYGIMPFEAGYLSIKIDGDNISETISFIESKWKEFVPNLDFEFFFVDENFDSQFRSEEKLSDLFRYFAFLAIFISGLGLFALAAYTAEQKTKEIGIRKVLGADNMQLMIMMNKSFLGVVLAASILTFPLIYQIMDRWLQHYAFRIEISFWLYVLSSVMALALAIITSAYQTFKAARANPVESLKYE